jgi:hypothetical protein
VGVVGELRVEVGFELFEARLDMCWVRGFQLRHERVDLVVAYVRDGQPEGAQHAGRQWDEDAADVQLLRERAGVKASSPAEGDQCQLTRVEAPFDADDT